MIDLTPEEQITLLSLQPGETVVLWRDIEPPVDSRHKRFPESEYRDVFPEKAVTGCWLWSKKTSGEGNEQQDLLWLDYPVQPGETFRIGTNPHGEVAVQPTATIRSVVPADDGGRTRWKIEVGR